MSPRYACDATRDYDTNGYVDTTGDLDADATHSGVSGRSATLSR
jgi:hypothetical protein